VKWSELADHSGKNICSSIAAFTGAFVRPKLCPRGAARPLLCSRNFDNPMTMKLEGDLDILKMYLHIENEVDKLRHSKLLLTDEICMAYYK